MRALNYEDQALSWCPDNGRAQRFVIINIVVLAVVLSVGLFLSSIELPEKERMIHVSVPERVAQFILESEHPKPKVSQEVISKPKTRPKQKPKPKLEPEVKREPTPKPKIQLKPGITENKMQRTDVPNAARERAERSGLLALSNELADLMDTSDVSAMVGKKIRRISDTKGMAKIDTGILDVGPKAAGAAETVMTENFSSTISSTTLGTQKRVVVAPVLTVEMSVGSDLVGAQEGSVREKKSTSTPGNFRTDEDIAYVMDQNKGRLYSVYRQARRKNPGLKGRIVFDITIQASGKVSGVVIRSSELNNAKLESRLLARVKRFDFGVREGEPITVTYPVEFLPS